MTTATRGATHIFLDLETTGFDPEVDVITEVAYVWSWLDSPDVTEREHFLLQYDGHPGRWAAANTSAWPRRDAETVCQRFAFDSFFDVCLKLSEHWRNDVYLVGATPAFDDRFLRKIFRSAERPYHDKLVDVSAMVMGCFGLSVPPKLSACRALLGLPGANERPHNALHDALEAKLIFDTVIKLNRERDAREAPPF